MICRVNGGGRFAVPELSQGIRPWVLLVAALTLVGCSDQPSQDAYIPPEDSAREALEVTLKGWQQGKPEGEVRSVGKGTKVQCLDQDWRAGKALSDFSILEAKPAAGSEPRQFKVQLRYQGEALPIEATYFVLGIDPLWVFREEDYRRTSGG